MPRTARSVVVAVDTSFSDAPSLYDNMQVSERLAVKAFVGGVLSGLLLSKTFHLTVRWIRRYLSSESQKPDVFHEVIFFPDMKPSCKAQYLTPVGCSDPRCKYAHKDTVLCDHLSLILFHKMYV